MPTDAPPQHLIDRTMRLVPPPMSAASSTLTWGREVVSFTVRQPAASWLRGAVAQVEELTALAANWDTYGAAPIAAGPATQAVKFLLDNAYSELAPPAVVPLSDGGVQLEWHRGGLDVEIAFSTIEPGVYIEDAETGESTETALNTAAATLTTYRNRLAS